MDFLFFLMTFVAEVVGTLAGFGSSTILLPIAVLFYDFHTALVLVAIVHIFGNIGRVAFFRAGLNKKIFIAFGLASVCFTLPGALLVTSLDQSTAKRFLGLFLLMYAIYTLFKPSLKLKLNNFTMAAGGAFSGFLAGLMGTGGPVRGAFLTAFGLPKMQYVSTAAAIALAVDMARLPVYFSQNLLDTRYYWFMPVLFAVALGGSFCGKKIVDKIPEQLFEKIVHLFIAFIGLYLIMNS